MMKHAIRALTLVALTATATSAFADDKKVIRIGHGVPEEAALHQGFEKFKEVVERESGGSLEVAIFPNQQLGGDRELIEGLQFDTVDMTAVSANNVAPFASSFFAFDTFFVFDNHAHAHRTFDGPAGEKLGSYLEPIGIKTLGYMENGFRSLTNSRGPITSLEELAGLKMRVAENPVQIAAWSALGANPTPMAWGELFTSLQQKVVDGQETSIELIKSQRFYEAQTDMTISRHTYTPFIVLASLNFWEGLSEDQRAVINTALDEAIPYQRERSKKGEEEAISIIADSGVRVHELSAEAKAEMKELLGEAHAMAKERAGEAFDVLMDGAEAARESN